MDVGRTESPPPVLEKICGKRPAEDEPTQKQRKTAAAAPRKPGGISLGDHQTNQTRRTTVFDWSDDDEVLMAPPPSTKEPPRSMSVGDQSGGGKEVHLPPTRTVPEQRAEGVSTQQTMEVPAGRATEVPEQQVEANLEQQAEQRSTEEEPRIPPQSMRMGPAAAPGGSGRHRRFKKLNRQTKP